MDSQLPPGQRETATFVRFGLPQFAYRFPAQQRLETISVGGDMARAFKLDDRLAALPRREQRADFHCVTSWSVRNLQWRGVSFRDFYQQLVVPLGQPDHGCRQVVFRGADGYRCCMLLEDLLADDVMLADSLNGEPLDGQHGAPLRLVAPAHYGYKNVKYLSAIEFWRDRRHYRFPLPYPRFMDHPRARVAFEERCIGMPNALMRPLYRSMISATRILFSRAQRREAQRRSRN